jgi:hypothetical protein
VLAYLLIAWPLYFATRRDRPLIDRFSFRIPELRTNPLRALGTLFSAPFFNHHLDQMIYSTALLALFGLAVERAVGTRRAVCAFAASNLVAAVGAGLVIHLAHARFPAWPPVRSAWARAYSGASAGGVGLAGVAAARSPWPYPALAVMAAWETGNGLLYLRNCTPAFHLFALATGFAAGRLFTAGPARPGTLSTGVARHASRSHPRPVTRS